MKRKLLAASLLALGLSLPVTGTQQLEPISFGPNEFRRVELPETSKVIREPVGTIIPLKQPDIKSVKPKIIDTSKPKTTNKISGTASWYCLSGVSRCTRGHGSGMYAAIRRDLLFLRGKTINVCAGKDCIRVTIIDCNCGSGANLIDLYSTAFRKLAPLSQGGVKVTISW